MRSIPLILLGLVACSSDKEPVSVPLPLDETLAAGETRAGRITKASELVGGLTQKGRVGDFKLYNDRIAVVIAPEEATRAYHPYGGIILDADLIRTGEHKSRFGEVIPTLDLAVLRPKTVEVISDGRDSPAQVRVTGEEDVMPLLDSIFSEIFPPTKHDMEWTIDYILEPNANWLRIEYTMFNRGRAEFEYGLPAVAFIFGDGADPFVEGYGFDPPDTGGTTDYYAAVADDVSYLYGQPGARATMVLTYSGLTYTGIGSGFSLMGRERKTITHYLVVGDGDLPKIQRTWRSLSGQAEGVTVAGRITDEANQPIAAARVHVTERAPTKPERDYVSRTETDDEGRYTLTLLPGSYNLLVATDAYIVSEPQALEVANAEIADVDVQLPVPGRVSYQVKDGEGTDLPIKLSIAPVGTTAQSLPSRYGEAPRKYGLIRTEFAHTGSGTFELPVGQYRVYISRGGEYEIDQQTFVVTTTGTAEIEAVLARSVSSTGWLTTDTHVHAQLSPDSPDLYPYKVRAMVAENLEIPVSTDHEAIGSFNPAIEELGLQRWIKGVDGSEITTSMYGHFNAFPLVQDFDAPSNGRIDWYYKSPAETFATIRANPGQPFIQVNHPRAAAVGGYFSAMGYDRETHTARRTDYSAAFDGIETTNGCGDGSMQREEVQDWFTFLNQGERKSATGSTDNHYAVGGNMGFPLTYVRMPSDDPAAAQLDDVRRAFMEGRLVVSCGPFAEMKVGQAEIGDLVETDGLVTLSARVEAATWMDVDTLQVVVNGAVEKTVVFDPPTGPVRFHGTVTASVPEGRDSWVILWVSGDQHHGVWSRHRPSYAFTNPIFLDGDGNGTWTMP